MSWKGRRKKTAARGERDEVTGMRGDVLKASYSRFNMCNQPHSIKKDIECRKFLIIGQDPQKILMYNSKLFPEIRNPTIIFGPGLFWVGMPHCSHVHTWLVTRSDTATIPHRLDKCCILYS